MPGETELSKLLKTLQPKLHAGEFVFCSVTSMDEIDPDNVQLLFKEEEGITVIIRRELADRLNLRYSFVASWIELTVHSSLAAVGLTAAFSTALADEGISCNVVAAFYHDHLFVDTGDAEKALKILIKLSS